MSHYDDVYNDYKTLSTFKDSQKIQYNSRLLNTSKLIRATTAITGHNVYSNNESVNFPDREQREAPLTLSSQRGINNNEWSLHKSRDIKMLQKLTHSEVLTLGAI